MIANIFHYVYFSGRPLGWLEYAAVKSCMTVNKPEKIFFYSDQELNGEWGKKIMEMVQFEKIEKFDEFDGVPVPHPAHKSDVVRLQKLIERGGVYLDLSVICRKAFTPLLSNRVVMGEEWNNTKLVGLCNAVILTQPNENFLVRFLEGFNPKRSLWAGFRSSGPEDIYYSEMSIKYSHFLANYWPEEIHIEPKESFFAVEYTDQDSKAFFEETDDGRWDECYCHKIWKLAREKYVESRREDSAFAKLVSSVT